MHLEWRRTAVFDTKPIKSTLGDGIHVKHNGAGYVVAPPSVVGGKAYEFIFDIEPAELPEAWITELIDNEKVERAERIERQHRERKFDSPKLSEKHGFDCFDVLQHFGHSITGKRVGNEIKMPHPHGSTTGTNLSVTSDGEKWHCWHHEVGGDATILYAVLKDIIPCQDAGSLDRATFLEVKRAMIRDCFIEEEPRWVKEHVSGGETQDDKIVEPLREWFLSPNRVQNQETIAALFARLHRDSLCYVNELNQWKRYNGKYWENDPYDGANAYMDYVNKLINFLRDEPVPKHLTEEDEIAAWKRDRDKCLGWAVKQNNAYAIQGGLEIAKKKAAVPLTDFDTNPMLWNCENGVMDLTTGEIFPQKPDNAATQFCDVPYVKGAKHPLWDIVLNRATGGSQQYIRHIQKEYGYSMTGRTEEEWVGLFVGEGATGKSTIYEPIMNVFGVGKPHGYGHYIRRKTLIQINSAGNAPNEDVLRLRTARLVMCSEVNKNTVFDSAFLKATASGEPIVARGLYARHIGTEYRPYYKLHIATNYDPVIPYDDSGAYRRIHVHPFTHEIPEEEQDNSIKHTLMTDLEAQKAILAWCVEGCLLWQKEGLGNKPLEVKRGGMAYRLRQNPLCAFFEDLCVLDPTANAKNELTRYTKFIATYNDHCELYGGRKISPDSFGKYVNNLGFETYRINVKDGSAEKKVRGIIGLRVKTISELMENVEYYDLLERHDKDEEDRAVISAYQRFLSAHPYYTQAGATTYHIKHHFQKPHENNRDENPETETVESSDRNEFYRLYENHILSGHVVRSDHALRPEQLAELTTIVRGIVSDYAQATAEGAPVPKPDYFVMSTCAMLRRSHPQFAYVENLEKIVEDLAEVSEFLRTARRA